MKKIKFYVVWSGNQPGVYDTWDDCKAQVHGVKGAVYKSFDSREEAEKAFASESSDYVFRKPLSSDSHKPSPKAKKSPSINKKNDREGGITWCVDAACSGNPGKMEYRGVEIPSNRLIFHFGPMYGTNNIGEFLAIVHAIALAQQQGLTHLRIYSDSRNAINWIRQKQCKTRLAHNKKSESLYALIERAENWLRTHTFDYPILKWETDEWGEIPADFGRK